MVFLFERRFEIMTTSLPKKYFPSAIFEFQWDKRFFSRVKKFSEDHLCFYANDLLIRGDIKACALKSPQIKHP